MMQADEVMRLAALARLELTDDEVKRFSRELGSILEYVKQLQEIDVTGVEPTSQVTGLMNVLREDVPSRQSSVVSRQELERMAPEFRDGYVVVPAVFGQQTDE